MQLAQLAILRGQLLGSGLQAERVALQIVRIVPGDLAAVGGARALRVLDELLELQRTLEHHRLLTRQHLLVDRVVEVRQLLEYHRVLLKLVADARTLVDSRRYLEAVGLELAHVAQQRDQLVAVEHVQLAVLVVKLHQFTICFQTLAREEKKQLFDNLK